MRPRKVFGIGLSRTGTTSLTRALGYLGIRCKHYPHDPVTKSELWSENSRLSLLERYDAITDISIVPFYQTLDRLYPGSQFILTERDEQSWLLSMYKHFRSLQRDDYSTESAYWDFTQAIIEKVYGGMTFDRERLRTRMRAHTAAVERYFAGRADDLLVMNIVAGDGWEKLCSFLNLPTPPLRFPRSNAGSKRLDWDRKVEAFKTTWSNLDLNPETTILLDDGKLSAYVTFGIDRAQSAEHIWFRGRPSNDTEARAQFAGALSSGVKTLVVAWPAFWWLRKYPGFGDMLRRRFRSTLRNEIVKVFDLTERDVDDDLLRD